MILHMQASNLQEAIQLVNSNKYRNWTTILIRSRAAAHTFQHEIDAGQLEVIFQFQCPFPSSLFTGSRASFAGDLNFYGQASVHFFT
jgi:malonate-semialdehyde dehydrogenase (acetylating)/methylmalonate-semialdehyde dehydrogenase